LKTHFSLYLQGWDALFKSEIKWGRKSGKNAFIGFESGAFNHSATHPHLANPRSLSSFPILQKGLPGGVLELYRWRRFSPVIRESSYMLPLCCFFLLPVFRTYHTYTPNSRYAGRGDVAYSTHVDL
jgi:hypothetical protein